MIAAAVICSAALVQAASVYWSFGTINAAGTDGSGWGADGLTGNVNVQLIIGTSLSGGVIGDTIYDATTAVTFDSGYAFPDGLDIAAMASDTPYYSALLQIVDTSLPSIAATRPNTALALWGRARPAGHPAARLAA